MSAFPATIPVRLDAEGRIDNDVFCPSCDYNLRMQRVADVVGRREGAAASEAGRPGGCPECGAELDVVSRDEADMFSRADPGWCRRVVRGADWLFYGAVGAMPLVLPGLVVATAGLWLMTGREPGRREGWKARGTRLSARWASVLGAGAGLALLVLLWWRWGEATRATFLAKDWLLGDILFCAVGASFAVGMLEAWRYLFALAARADGPRVAQACRAAWKRYLLGVGVVVGLALAVNVAERSGIRLPEPWNHYTVTAGFAVVGAVAVWLWWVTVGLTREIRRLLRGAVAAPQRETPAVESMKTDEVRAVSASGKDQ
ncbi:MAG: hypothetical protein AAGG38_03410 [Planctomycetota bacterium]